MNDNEQQEPTESGDTGETGTPETSERVEERRGIETQDSISQYVTEDNFQLIVERIIEETNLSDLEETGKIYYCFWCLPRRLETNKMEISELILTFPFTRWRRWRTFSNFGRQESSRQGCWRYWWESF